LLESKLHAQQANIVKTMRLLLQLEVAIKVTFV